MPRANIRKEIAAPQDGVIVRMECDEIGNASMILGGGRAAREDTIDLTVGLVLSKKIGDTVKKGETVAVLYANDDRKLADAEQRFHGAIDYAPTGTPAERRPIVLRTLD